MKVAVINASGEDDLPELPEGTVAVELGPLVTGEAFDGYAGLVLYAPPPGWHRERPVARSIGRLAIPAILVRRERWDGSTPDPLAAACRGVISGFGGAGVIEAVRELMTSRR